MRYLFLVIILGGIIFYGMSAQWSKGEHAMESNNESSRVCIGKKTISIILDSSFNKNECFAIAEFLKNDIEMRNIKALIIDVQDYNLPFIYTKTPPMLGNGSSDPVIKKWSKLINKSDAFILIAAEHNGSYVGTFKNALDLLYAEWNNKPAGLVVYSPNSSTGGILIEQLRKVTHALKMIAVPADVVITPTLEKNGEVFILTPSTKTELQLMAEHIINTPPVGWVTKIKNGIGRHGKKIGFKIVQAFTGIVHLFYKKSVPKLSARRHQKLLLRDNVIIKIILGSTRNGRVSMAIGTAIQNIMKEQLGVDASIIDLKEYNLAPVNQDNVGVQETNTQQWNAAIASADALIIVLPEYNAGLPAVLKNGLDSLSLQKSNKPVGIISYSAGRGGKNAVADLQAVLDALKMKLISPTIYIPNTWQVLDSKGHLLQANLPESLSTLVHNLIKQ